MIAHAVALRTREIGVRAALGASKGSLLLLVVRQGMAVVVLGLSAGLVAALIVTRLFETLLYGVGPWDPKTMATAVVVMATVALIACYIPARRATVVDPLVALRSE